MDPERMKQAARRIAGTLNGTMTAVMIHLGDRMGFYRALADGGPRSSRQLADELSLDERWVREWLHQQAAAGILQHEGGSFFLDEESALLLSDENHPAFLGGMFGLLPQQIAVAEKLPEAFRSGLGLPYDAFGPEGAVGIERGFAPWFRSLLVPMALPRLPGVVEALERGVEVADVGCGAGVALLEMAKAFPHSRFHGFEISLHALERAVQNRREAGVENVTFHDARRNPLPGDGRYAFVTCFDCLHDMTDPAAVSEAIRAAIRDDGVWFIAEMKARPTLEENLERNPMAAMMYGVSVLSCLSSSLSEPGGAGLGTLGLDPTRLDAMVKRAGFSSLEEVDLHHPVNAFYAVRP
jgi:2-polyprenyl-3-methyl-5-hydroxy-6-metoxy-1,4-benzoquinol methylase